jgi:predicted  nucleic acid-binding Zn-ribbon protein
MNADLERLITLQKIDSAAEDAKRRIAEEPARLEALDARVEQARQTVAAAKEQLAANQLRRRELEKEIAMHQGRLSKFREQAMAVKTNQEYHAMQKEIGFAQGEVKALEDQMLERMLEGDELTGAVKKAEAALAAEQKAVDADKRAIGAELAELSAAVERLGTERAAVIDAIDPSVLATFEMVAGRRHGVGVAEARDGHCTICHVRLRPQVFNTIRRNESIVQCDSCQRIMYFSPVTTVKAAENVTPSAQ